MIREAIARLIQGTDLSAEEAGEVMQEIMTGQATPSQIAGFLVALRIKQETPEEIAACARVMKAHAIKVESSCGCLMDTCGTGGDGAGTFNVSTVVAFVLAGAGVPVAKHGNRSVSSQCGSADVLEALGARIDLGPDEIAACLKEAGIGFLFAPRLHPAMKYAAVPRRELGARTIFNVLGPLTNPASATVQLLGVYDPRLTEVLANVLALLGIQSAMVVHGDGGLDEISITGPSKITSLKDGEISTYYLDPRDYGFSPADPGSLRGGSPMDNASIALDILGGRRGTKRDMVLLNAAAGLMAAGRVDSMGAGLEMAAESIDSGKAKEKLDRFVTLSCALGGAA